MKFPVLKRALSFLALIAACSTFVLGQEEEVLELPLWSNSTSFQTEPTPIIPPDPNAPQPAPQPVEPIAPFQAEAASDPEIVTLAASLGNDPLKIFNYVRNRISYEHYYGLKKGAVITLVEGCGNDFDQCALLKALLVAAGQTEVALVKHSQVVPLVGNDGKNICDWLGLAADPYPGKTYFEAYNKNIPTPWVDAGLTQVEAKRLQNAAQYLSSGGSPEVNFWTDCKQVVFARVWVRLGSGTTAKNLDPSFKRTERLTPLNLATLTGYNRTALLAAATNGDTLTGNGWVQKLNKTGLTTYLDGIATTLTNTLRGQYPNATIEEIIGGRKIIREDAASLSDCFPLGTTFHPYYSETVWPVEVPSDHLVKMRFLAGNIDYTIPTAELGDDRVTLSFAGNSVKLWVEDTEVDSHSTTANNLDLTTSVIHPGPTGTGSKTSNYKKHNSYAYALIHGFAPTGKSLKRRYDRLNSYLDSGLADDSREVRSELLNIMGTTWLYQTCLLERIIGAKENIIYTNHHRVGRVAQESGFYIDVGLSLSANFAPDGSRIDMDKLFYGGSLFISAMEHGIIEQLQPGYEAVSTVNLIRRANDAGQKIYLANSTNWTTGPTADRVKGQLSNYSSADLAAIQAEIDLGRMAILPKNAKLTEGSWTGIGYVIKGPQTLQLPAGQLIGPDRVGMIISGGYGGGYSTSVGWVSSPPIYNSSAFNPSFSYSAPVAEFDSYISHAFSMPPMFGADPVDMATGAFTYGATDLETGLEPSPRGLRFARYYDSNSRSANSQNLGYGWTHDLYIRAEKRTASEEGLGLGSPRQAALILASVTAVSDLFRSDASPKENVAAALVAGWGVDRLTNNAVSIVIGQQVIQFTKHPDGTFEPPNGSTMELVATGSGSTASYSLNQRHGNTIAFQYNSTLKVHRAGTITDPDGKAMSFAYLSDGRINYVQDAYGRRYTFGYTGTGVDALITSITDSTGRSVSYGYGTDGKKNLSSFTDPEGKTENYDYALSGDPVGQAALHCIRRVRDQLGRTVTENDFDNFGRVVTQRLHGDSAKTYTLKYTGRINTETNPEGGVTKYFYDDRGRSTGTEDPEGKVTSWEYDGQDHVVAKTSKSGETTVYHYDGRHNLWKIDHPRGGGATVITYDSLDRIDFETDPDGRQTDYVYNAGNTKNRPDQVIDASGTTNYQYKTAGAAIGRVWKMTTPEGLVAEVEYDGNGHPDWTKKPGGYVTDFTYNARGDLQQQIDPNLVTTAYLYNNRRQVTRTTVDSGGADQAVEDIAYDDAGNVASVTAPEDNGGQRFKTRSEYSPTKKVRYSYSTDEDGEGVNDPVTEVRYDNRDWQKESLDPLSRLTTYTPKPNGDLFQTTLPLGRSSTQVLDGDERPTSSTSPGSSGNRTTTMAYGVTSALDGNKTTGYPRTITTTPDGLSVTDEHEHGGELRFHTNREGHTWEFRYDGMGRRTHVITPLGAGASNAHMTDYFPRGVVKKVTEPSGQVTDFTYSPTDGRLDTVTDGVGTVQNTLYDSNGNLKTSVETRGGVAKTTQRTYDRQNRLLSRTDENGQTVGYRYYPSGKLKKLIYPGGTEIGTGHVEYTWWKSGQLKQVIDKLDSTTTPRTTSYEWNKDGKLKKVTRPNGTIRAIKYDAAGRPNIIEEYAPGGKLIFVHKHGFYPSDEMEWRFELPSRRTSGLPPPAAAAMTYDADNRLDTWGGMSVVQDADGNMTSGPSPSGSSLVTYSYDTRNRLTGAMGFTYTYDSDGHRIGVTGPSETASYVVDGSTELSKTLIRTKNGVATRYVWGAGLLYEVNGTGAGATTTSYHYDATGNTLALTDQGANVVERIGYTPLGTIEHRINVSGTPYDTPFLFTGFFGNQTDGNGLLHMRARYYHPRLGRFLNADPAREGWNWYGYAGGNPIGNVDPSGLGIDDALNMVQDTLSYMGMLPVFGAAFDIVNAGISLVRGDFVGAGLNLLSAAPGIGDLAGATKIAGIVGKGYVGGKILAHTAGVMPVFAAKANNVVYQSVSKVTGAVDYVGITSNYTRRAAEHAKSARNLSIIQIPGLSNLTRWDARAVEQVLINHHGLTQKGGSLLNLINSIAPNNPIYKAALSRGEQILKSVKYPGF